MFRQKLERILTKISIYGVLFFFILQLSTCYPSVGYPFRMIIRPINQAFLAKKTNTPLGDLKETYEDYTDPHPSQLITVNGHKIQKTFVKIYRATGYVAWVDQNDALIKSWYLASGNVDGSTLYHEVAPIDLSLVFGKTAEKENLKKIKFSHIENTLETYILPGGYYDSKEVTNIHIIPSSNVIKKALKNINRGETIYVEGYLTDWKGTGDLSYADYNTARYAGEVSEYISGGQKADLCKQLFLTKLILNGYIYE